MASECKLYFDALYASCRALQHVVSCFAGVGHSVVMSDEKEASGERTTLPPEYDSAYLQNGDAAPTETLTVFFDDVDQNLTRGSSRNRKTEATRQLNKPITKATAGVLPRHTFRQEYVVYDASQVRLLRYHLY